MRAKFIPPDFELEKCPTCGWPIDFTFGLRKCAGCKRRLCVNCVARTKSMAKPSMCNRCHRNSGNRK